MLGTDKLLGCLLTPLFYPCLSAKLECCVCSMHVCTHVQIFLPVQLCVEARCQCWIIFHWLLILFPGMGYLAELRVSNFG